MSETLRENGWTRRGHGSWFHENYGSLNFAYAYRLEAERKVLRSYVTGCITGFVSATMLIALISMLWRSYT